MNRLLHAVISYGRASFRLGAGNLRHAQSGESPGLSRHQWCVGPEPRLRSWCRPYCFLRRLQAGLRTHKPMFDDQLHLPTKTRIDGPLIIGSAIFGVGWGLAGFCPGPAITALSLGMIAPVIFAVAMLAGMLVHDRFMAGKG